MTINPDGTLLFQWGWFTINATIFFTWLVMALLTLGSWLVTRNLKSEGSLSRWQNLLEVLVNGINSQIREVSRQEPGPYLPFVGTLFIFIAISNILTIIPGFIPPTSSLSTTAALAICVFIAVPVFGIAHRGVLEYLRQYLKPTFFMLPFNIIGELSRTLALAVRLYGNMMSGTIIVAILLTITPLIFPIVMQALGLLTGLIQAYIFAILAMVYIASASKVHQDLEKKGEE
ncbi:MAG: F0F1 ATP synthase subunit A [Bacillota bacterium]|nr:F0F1 ATP synthase subunit A [Bacillota bacterium]